MIKCKNSEYYKPGDTVVSLVNHSPIVKTGTVGKILNRWAGTLYAVKLPNGEYYRWLDSHDLDPIDPSQHTLRVGDSAILNTNRHEHFYHPLLKTGLIVRIVKIIKETDYYDISINDVLNHAWIAGFEISNIL